MAFFTSTVSPQINPNPTLTTIFLPRITFRVHEFRLWRRRRLKPKRQSFSLREDLESSSMASSSMFDFFSHLPFNWLPPTALGFASAIALSLPLFKSNETRLSDSSSRPEFDSDSRVFDIGDWILFTSPTPFNRFVLLRCPSISFEGGEFLEDVNDRLVKEDKHYVRLDSGRIQVRKTGEERGNGFEYQRVCVGTDDGGVISLDWPANLDLTEEHGLDTTVLLIPGTADGSMDEDVRSFVLECLRRGLFPVVMNPRGCAGSPLTTARLFSAADSDDICSAIQFITRARPWSTLTGVGWGYGANMLTKYLAEAGERTPLTAATCIDNPFDLDEATRTSPYSTAIDIKLTNGLIDILKSNKELFQGKRKGFDVEKALSAESVREFEKAISMVSYGFESIEEFYSNSSTRSVVGKLKIPVLYIQNDDGTVPLFSIPRGLMAENPFTSLLLCSCLPSNVTASSWYQQVTIEWLAAVELGLLKGRHPLLQDVDVTINPSKGLALVDGRTSDINGRPDRILNLSELDDSDAYMDIMKEQESDSAATAHLNSIQASQRDPDRDDKVASELNRAFLHSSSVDADTGEGTGSDPVESDRGQVLQTAQVVMNMLDVTMPGTLKEEDKRKVLTAVGQGETLVKALQDAVPEDVRGKLSTSVSEILQAQGKSLNFEGLLSINQIANASTGLRSKIKEKVSNYSDTTTRNSEYPSVEKVSGSDLKEGNDENQVDIDKLAEGAHPPGNSVKSLDLSESKSLASQDGDIDMTKGFIDSQNSDDKLDSNLSAEKVSQLSASAEDGSETNAKMRSYRENAGSTDSGEVSVTQGKSQDEASHPDTQEDNNISSRVTCQQYLCNDQNKPSSSVGTGEASTSPVSEGELLEKGDDDNKSKDEKLVQPPLDRNRPSDTKSTTFNVAQALDALTGLDDSTQVAVNSVFGVIENMITHLEEKKNEDTIKKVNEVDDTINGSVIKNCISSDLNIEKQKEGEDLQDTSLLDMELVPRNDENTENSQTIAADRKENNEKMNLVVNQLGMTPDGFTNINYLPLYIKNNPYAKALYNEHLRKYVLSKLQKMKPLKLDTTTALFIDYIPEEGRWLLLEQPAGDIHDGRKDHAMPLAEDNITDNVIETSYVVLDSERREEPAGELKAKETLNNIVYNESKLGKSSFSVKTLVMDSLKVEVSRRLNAAGMKDIEAGLAAEMEEVANSVYLAIQPDKEHNEVQECGIFYGDHIIEVISLAVQNTSYLKRVLPVGVIVGSTLAALRNFFNVATVHDDSDTQAVGFNQDCINSLKSRKQPLQEEAIQLLTEKVNLEPIPEKISRTEEKSTTSKGDDRQKAESSMLNRDTVMVGAMTAALGASALLTSEQEGFMGSNSNQNSSYCGKKDMQKVAAKLEEVVDDKHQSNIVTSLAEKAMSVAAPVVPTKEDGAVDHERVVTMLAELGQKGGVLKLVGKLALLWGGLRGAMSLTDRLISFLRIAQQPLLHRVLGFFCMVLVLWSPVLVPLLPTLLHNWATHNSSRIAELACILGLYAAVTILIMQWGRRIRGHEYPLKQYGLDLMSPRKTQDFFTGLVGGVMLVLCIQSVNSSLGFINLSWPSNLSPYSLDVAAKIRAHGQLFLLAGQGIVTATGIAFVEELLFRSWLLEEITADLGHHAGIILSGLAFSLSKRSLLAIPGLWLLSMCLAGARLRNQGSLFIPAGLRTGIMATSFTLKKGGFLIYEPKFHNWVTGSHAFEPFSGVVGLLIALLLAAMLYPRQPGLREKIRRSIRA